MTFSTNRVFGDGQIKCFAIIQIFQSNLNLMNYILSVSFSARSLAMAAI